MNIRESIHKHPAIPMVVAALAIAGGIVGTYLQIRQPTRPAVGHQRFYSDDDGQTWFPDELTKIPPFDHNGKPAYAAAVFRCGSGKPFVAYLQRFSEKAKPIVEAKISQLAESAPISPIELQMAIGTAPFEVKKPGDPNWIPGNGPKVDASAVSTLLNPICAGGADPPERVFP